MVKGVQRRRGYRGGGGALGRWESLPGGATLDLKSVEKDLWRARGPARTCGVCKGLDGPGHSDCFGALHPALPGGAPLELKGRTVENIGHTGKAYLGGAPQVEGMQGLEWREERAGSGKGASVFLGLAGGGGGVGGLECETRSQTRSVSMLATE